MKTIYVVTVNFSVTVITFIVESEMILETFPDTKSKWSGGAQFYTYELPSHAEVSGLIPSPQKLSLNHLNC